MIEKSQKSANAPNVAQTVSAPCPKKNEIGAFGKVDILKFLIPRRMKESSLPGASSNLHQPSLIYNLFSTHQSG
jgi:hypothetical protein